MSEKPDRERIAQIVADGFSNGNESFDEASEPQQFRYLMAADAILSASEVAERGEPVAWTFEYLCENGTEEPSWEIGASPLNPTGWTAFQYRNVEPTYARPPALPVGAEPCFECGSTERIGTACKPCNPELEAEVGAASAVAGVEIRYLDWGSIIAPAHITGSQLLAENASNSAPHDERITALEAAARRALPILSDRYAGGRMMRPREEAGEVFDEIMAALQAKGGE